jgi:hypothetical protein
MLMNKVVSVLVFLVLSSCAYYSPIYWGWGEWAGPEVSGIENNSVARFDWSRLPGVITMINRDSVGAGYKKAKLIPGRYLINYAYYPAEFGTHPSGLIEIELSAGHEYEFRIKLCYACSPREYITWVQDKTTGEIVWGQLKGK